MYMLSGTMPFRTLNCFRSALTVKLQYNYLSGYLGPSLAYSKTIAFLWLHGNRLSGSIPPLIGPMVIVFFLSHNALSGTLPPSLLNSTIIQFDVTQSRLSGTIPPILSRSGFLMGLMLTDNPISGTISSVLWGLSNATVLSLGRCKLSGQLIPQPESLRRLDLSGNRLSGTLNPGTTLFVCIRFL